MRRLMLLRHAKALRTEGLRDFDRPLKTVGREQSRLIGQFMAGRRLEPGLALVSTALRARETFDLVDIFLHPPPERVDEPLIYEATAESLLDIVRGLPARYPSALLVGHNPAFEELAKELTVTGAEAALSRFSGHMPPAALAVIDFSTDRWKKVEERSGSLALFATPALVAAEK